MSDKTKILPGRVRNIIHMILRQIKRNLYNQNSNNYQGEIRNSLK